MRPLRAYLAAAEMLATTVARSARPGTNLLSSQRVPCHARSFLTINSYHPVPQWQTTTQRSILSRSASTAAGTAAVAPDTAAQQDCDSLIQKVSYDHTGVNHVSLTGTLMSPIDTAKTRFGDYNFAIRVKDTLKVTRPNAPDIYTLFRVVATGELAAELEQQEAVLQQDVLISVQGRLGIKTDQYGAASVYIQATSIGLCYSPTPESLVQPGAVLQPANPQQFDPHPDAVAASSGTAEKKPLPEGMPDKPANDTEAMWVQVFKCPQAFWDNRGRKTERQPDFKNKATGVGLWLDSRNTPQWVLANTHLLPHNPAADAAEAEKFRTSLAGGLLSGRYSDKDTLWAQLVVLSDDWVDNRLRKAKPDDPDFIKKPPHWRDDVKEKYLWLNDPEKPAWVDKYISHLLPPPPQPDRQPVYQQQQQ